ncbi:hypothetical protein H8356DRAFT_1325965 [Neocallimastix lanati (nom. inval.)]|nr:hypothetical protein H8356DRAFT_1325965 [Neocallimastix sp. JGI-2020a]
MFNTNYGIYKFNLLKNSRRVEIDKNNNNGKTALVYACKNTLVYTCQNNKDLEPIKLLLENGTISNIISNNEILNIYLINNGSEINLTDKENIELLIKYRNNIYVKRKHDWSTYLLACKYGAYIFEETDYHKNVMDLAN